MTGICDHSIVWKVFEIIEKVLRVEPDVQSDGSQNL